MPRKRIVEPPPSDLDAATEDEILELAGRIVWHRMKRRLAVGIPYVGTACVRVSGSGAYLSADTDLRNRGTLRFLARFDINEGLKRHLIRGQLNNQIQACPRVWSSHGVDNQYHRGRLAGVRKNDAEDYPSACRHPGGAGHEGPCLSNWGDAPFLDGWELTVEEAQQNFIRREQRYNRNTQSSYAVNVARMMAPPTAPVVTTEDAPAPVKKKRKPKQDRAESQHEATRATMKRIEVD